MKAEYQKLLTDFIMAVVSGGVAGLMAAWVLLRVQMRFQLGIDDISKIVDLLHSLEEFRDDLSNAIVTHTQYSRAGATEEAEQAQKQVQTLVQRVRTTTYKLATQIENIRAPAYRTLRAYLLLRIRREFMFANREPHTVTTNLGVLIQDIREYVYGPITRTSKFGRLWRRAEKFMQKIEDPLSKSEKDFLLYVSSFHNRLREGDIISDDYKQTMKGLEQRNLIEEELGLGSGLRFLQFGITRSF
jgi:hypothetical protein